MAKEPWLNDAIASPWEADEIETPWDADPIEGESSAISDEPTQGLLEDDPFAEAYSQVEARTGISREDVSGADIVRRGIRADQLQPTGLTEPKGVGEALSEIGEQPEKLIPFLGQGVDLARMEDLYGAAKRIESGKGTEDDQALVRTWMARSAEDAKRGSELGYDIVNILGQLPGFVGEFVTTGGIYTTGKKVASKGILKALKETIESAAEKGLLRKGVEAAGGAALQTLPVMGMRIPTGAMDRMLQQYDFSENQKGKLKAVMAKGGDNFNKALLKSFGDAYIEMLSERSGGALPEIWNKLPIAKKVGAMKAAVLSRWLKKNPNKKVGDFLKTLRTKAGWHGVVGEMFEERVGEAARYATGVEDEYTPAVLAERGKLGKQLLAEAIAFSVPGASAAALRRITKEQKPPTPKIPPEVIPEEITPEPAAGMEGVDFVPPETDEIVEPAPTPKMPAVEFEPERGRAPERYGLAPDEFTEVEPPAYPADMAEDRLVEPPVAPEPVFQPGERGLGQVAPEAELVAPIRPPEPTPTEKPRKIPTGKWNKPADPVTDDLIMATAKLGGISRKEAISQGIDPAEFKVRRGRPLFPAQGGKKMDAMAKILSERGYPVTDEKGNYSANVMLDSLTSALRGESVYSTQVDPDILAESQGLFDAEEQATLEAAKAAAATKLEGRKKSDQKIVESYIANKYGRPATQEEVEAIGEEMKSPDSIVERAARAITKLEKQVERGLPAHQLDTFRQEVSDMTALIDEMLPATKVAVKKTKKTKAEKKVKKVTKKPTEPKYTKEQIKLEEIATRYEAIGKKKDAERIRKASFKEKVDVAEFEKAITEAEKQAEAKLEGKPVKPVEEKVPAKEPDIFDNPPDYSSQTVATGKEKGIPVEAAQKVVDKFLADYNGPEIKVIVVNDQSVFKKKPTGNIKGGFYADTNNVVLIADNLESNRDAYSTLRHEILAHYGLGLFDAKTRNNILDVVHKSRNGILLNKTYREVRKDYKNLNDRKMAEEVFANIAQEQPTKATEVWDKIVEMVMQALRKIGLLKGYVAKSELRNLVASIGEGIRKGKKLRSKGEGVAFAKKKDPSEKNDADEFTVEWTGTTPASQVSPTPKEVISRIDKYHPNAAKKMKRWFRRDFTKEGLLDKESYRSKIKMEAEKNVGELDISAFVHDMNNAIAKAYGKKSYNAVSKSDLENVNSYLAGQDVKLPAGLKEELDILRAHLDRLSGGMLAALEDLLKIQISQLSESQRASFDNTMRTGEGSVPQPIQKYWNMYQTITNNIGTYMTRSYQAFDDPKWKDKVLRNKDLIARAENYIRENNPDLIDDEVTGAVRGILQSAKDSGNFFSFVAKGSKAGTKDISILKKKKDVPAIIRELLGEYKDPKVNYVRSATKMQYYIANHHFLMRIREHGLGVFLFDKRTGVFDTPLAGKLSETLNPLNGLYTTEDFRQGLEDAHDNFVAGDIMRMAIRINSAVKYGKTILAPTTVARNFQSAFLFTIMNGHFNMIHAAKAFRAAKADLFTKDKEWLAYLKKLVGMGVLHDNPMAQELKAAFNDFINIDVYSQGRWQKTRKFLDFMQKLYQVGDDFWKIVGFENEVALQLKKGISLEQAEKNAAERIRNGYPTYSMVPRMIKAIRRWWLIGTFVSFPYEVIRTSYNQIGFIREDLINNPPAAARRILGVAVASSVTYAASIASMMALGISGEDDEAIRSLGPKWSRNSQFLYVGYDKDGMPVYYDMSYSDPYTYWKKIFSALLSNNNEGIDKKIMDALKEFLEPFVGVEISAGALMEIISNKKEEGGIVYNTEDTAYKQSIDIIDHARKSVQPGVVSNIERTVKALGGIASKTGRKYDVSDELFAWGGIRAATLDIPTSMVYKSYAFMDRKIRATKILTGKAGSQKKMTDPEISDATNEMLVARERAYKDMIKLVNGAKKLGMTNRKLRKVMSSAGVSRRDINSMIRGKTPRWRISNTFMKSAKDRAMATAPNMKRKAELRTEMANRIRVIRRTVRKSYMKK